MKNERSTWDKIAYPLPAIRIRYTLDGEEMDLLIHDDAEVSVEEATRRVKRHWKDECVVANVRVARL